MMEHMPWHLCLNSFLCCLPPTPRKGSAPCFPPPVYDPGCWPTSSAPSLPSNCCIYPIGVQSACREESLSGWSTRWLSLSAPGNAKVCYPAGDTVDSVDWGLVFSHYPSKGPSAYILARGMHVLHLLWDGGCLGRRVSCARIKSEFKNTWPG
jgi:hypothetical protein